MKASALESRRCPFVTSRRVFAVCRRPVRVKACRGVQEAYTERVTCSVVR
jgi:hypothetical protein